MKQGKCDLFCWLKREDIFSNDSAGDVGSTCASMNRTGKSYAKKGPKVGYNAYKDFHHRETEAHIIASFLKFAGMSSIEGKVTVWQMSYDFVGFCVFLLTK